MRVKAVQSNAAGEQLLVDLNQDKYEAHNCCDFYLKLK